MYKLTIIILFSAPLLTSVVVCERELCSINKMRSCSKQLLGYETQDESLCEVHYYPTNSSQCSAMSFGEISDNPAIGEVRLEPYLWDKRKIYYYTVFNITFTNINWRTLRFRFQRNGIDMDKKDFYKNHCRKIDIDKSVVLQKESHLYYDCFWSRQFDNYEGDNFTFEYEAEGEAGRISGRYIFIVPSTDSLFSNVKFANWQPFVYIETKSDTIKLYITQSPEMGIDEYIIEFMALQEQNGDGNNDIVIEKITKPCEPEQDVIVYEHNLSLDSGYYYFIVTPIKDGAVGRKVKSAIIFINSDMSIIVICLAIVTLVLMFCLFAYCILLRVRKYFCVEKAEKAAKIRPKILVIYSPLNKLHKECVVSLVNYLRLECGFQVMYDADIAKTQHKDPYVWCQESFAQAVCILNVVSPAVDQNNSSITNIRNVDSLQLEMLKNTKCRAGKSVLNIVFPHCKNMKSDVVAEKTFYLLKDWQNFMSFISNNLLPPYKLARSENGRTLLADFTEAKKCLNEADSA